MHYGKFPVMHFNKNMNKLFLFFLSLFIFTNHIFSQNLVPNPSFEIYNICPDNVGQIDKALQWYHEELNISQGDYYNSCDDFTGFIQNTQQPNTGIGMAAFVVYTSPSATYEFREYIKVQLKSVLKTNSNYCISYYTSLSGLSTYAIDALCACISIDSLICQDPNIMLLPCSNFVCNHIGNIIKDTLNWVKVTMNYTAHGGEQFLTIGNFKTSQQTNTEIIGSGFGLPTYYFIDDVAVYECNTQIYVANAGSNKCIKAGDSLALGTPTRAEYLYWWYDMQGNLLDTTATITVKPTQTTSYILVQKDFKFDETRDTVTINIGNCPIDYSGDSFEIYPNPTNGQVNVLFNTKVPIGTVMQLYDILGQKVAEFPLTSVTNIATVNLGNLATAVYHATVLVPDGFRKSVKLVFIKND